MANYSAIASDKNRVIPSIADTDLILTAHTAVTHNDLTMKRLLIYILLIANLCSGLAFAWDTHPEALLGHDQAMLELIADGEHQHPGDDLHHSDHCCHGVAHLVGVFYAATTRFSQSGETHFCSSIPVAFTHSVTPLLRPPIV